MILQTPTGSFTFLNHQAGLSKEPCACNKDLPDEFNPVITPRVFQVSAITISQSRLPLNTEQKRVNVAVFAPRSSRFETP